MDQEAVEGSWLTSRSSDRLKRRPPQAYRQEVDTPMNDPNRDAVHVRLETLGFVVRMIPETSTWLQPDLVAHSEGVTMYVEVKTRSERSHPSRPHGGPPHRRVGHHPHSGGD